MKDLISAIPNSFDMIGKKHGNYDITIDPNIPPVQHACRHSPTGLRECTEEKLNEMCKLGVIPSPQVGSRPWISLLTYPKKE